jgi:hypothetical protein
MKSEKIENILNRDAENYKKTYYHNVAEDKK